ncbi:transposase [Mesorhizobium sp. M0115]
MRLAFCWAHRRRKLIKSQPKKGSPSSTRRCCASPPSTRSRTASEVVIPIIAGLSARTCPARWWTRLVAHAARVSRKSDLGEAMAYMLKRQAGFQLFLDDGRVDIDSNLVEKPTEVRP